MTAQEMRDFAASRGIYFTKPGESAAPLEEQRELEVRWLEDTDADPIGTVAAGSSMFMFDELVWKVDQLLGQLQAGKSVGQPRVMRAG